MAQAENLEDSSSPADGHQAILNKANKKSKDEQLYVQLKQKQKHRLGTASKPVITGAVAA